MCGILSALCAARLVSQRPAGGDGVQITCQPRKCDSQEEISALSAQHWYTGPSLEMIIWGALHRSDQQTSQNRILRCNISRCCSVEIFIVIKMQQVQFETSMKNIPLGGKKEYVMQLTKSVRKVVYAISNCNLHILSTLSSWWSFRWNRLFYTWNRYWLVILLYNILIA